MEIIEYETDVLTCLTPCPHGVKSRHTGELLKVGSFGCAGGCKYIRKKYIGEGKILCRYIEKTTKKI